MTLSLFKLLSREVQLRYVLLRGTYLAQRWEEGFGAHLYYLPDSGRGFFVEVGFEETLKYYMVLRSFSSSGPLVDYAQGVQLPGK